MAMSPHALPLLSLLLAAAAGQACGCTFEQNFDYNGHDLRPGGDAVNVLNATECCAVCSATAGCFFWTLQLPNTCYLKTSDAGRRTYANAVSGSFKGPPPPAPPAVTRTTSSCVERPASHRFESRF